MYKSLLPYFYYNTFFYINFSHDKTWICSLYLISEIFLLRENTFSLTSRIFCFFCLLYQSIHTHIHKHTHTHTHTSIFIPRTHPSTSTISHKIKLKFSLDSYARSNEAQRDFRRSTPSNEYISINVSRVSFESSASRNMKCHLLEHIARHTHEHMHTHTHTRSRHDRKWSRPWQSGNFITIRRYYYKKYIVFNYISWIQKQNKKFPLAF